MRQLFHRGPPINCPPARAVLHIGVRYLLAVALVLTGWWITTLVWDHIKPGTPTLFIAVIATAWFGGLGPALLASGMAGYISTYYFPSNQPGFDTSDFVRLCVYVVMSILLSWLNAARFRLHEEIRERKLAQDETLAHQERLRQLAAELSLTEERQRRHLATQLHDEIGQTLAISQIRLEALGDAAASPDLRAGIGEVRALIESAVTQTRSLTRELSPPVLYDAGFEPAIEWLADRMQKEHQLSVSVADHGERRPISEEMRVFLFQALRELLVNIVKHARAGSAQISIFRQPDHIRLIVEDDGCGFEPAAPPYPRVSTNGFGLLNIRERLTYLGGQLEIESASGGGGARFTLTAPLTHHGRTAHAH